MHHARKQYMLLPGRGSSTARSPGGGQPVVRTQLHGSAGPRWQTAHGYTPRTTAPCAQDRASRCLSVVMARGSTGACRPQSSSFSRTFPRPVTAGIPGGGDVSVVRERSSTGLRWVGCPCCGWGKDSFVPATSCAPHAIRIHVAHLTPSYGRRVM